MQLYYCPAWFIISTKEIFNSTIEYLYRPIEQVYGRQELSTTTLPASYQKIGLFNNYLSYNFRKN